MTEQLTDCRVCSNPEMELVGSLGDIALSDFTTKSEKRRGYPLALTYCNDCTLVQLDQTVPRDQLYSDYWYKSGISPVIKQDLSEIVGQVRERAHLRAGDLWTDIGANDGTLLSFVPNDMVKIGVDPAPNFQAELARNADFAVNKYWEDAHLLMKSRVISAIACLYDLPDPNAFMKQIKSSLSDDGVFVAQLMTLAPMVEKNDVGNICHEHVEYYSYQSLTTLYEQNGLAITEVQENDINGGSYRVFAEHAKGMYPIHVPQEESSYDGQDLREFFERVEQNKQDLLNFVKDHRVYGYGASTKGNTLLQYYGLTAAEIPGIVDINPRKAGKHTVNTEIPITGMIPPDCEYLWVMPWGFIDHFVEKERDFRERGGKFIVSTPEFKVI